MFSNYPSTITIDVTTVVVGQEYYINTLWQKISYTAQVGDLAIDILNALNAAWDGIDATTSIVNNQLVITKGLSDYFYYFELSDNLEFTNYLSGKIIIQDQDSPQPDKTYLTIKIITGVDDVAGNNLIYDGKYKSSDLKRFTLNVQAYGSESFDYISYLKSIIMLDETVSFCKNKGISFVSPQQMDDVSAPINNEFEQRHSLDIICYTTDEINLSKVTAESAFINLNLVG
jgi:hypothetical protein